VLAHSHFDLARGQAFLVDVVAEHPAAEVVAGRDRDELERDAEANEAHGAAFEDGSLQIGAQRVVHEREVREGREEERRRHSGHAQVRRPENRFVWRRCRICRWRLRRRVPGSGRRGPAADGHGREGRFGASLTWWLSTSLPLEASSRCVRRWRAAVWWSPAAGSEVKRFYMSGGGVTWCALIGWSHVFGRRALEYTERGSC